MKMELVSVKIGAAATKPQAQAPAAPPAMRAYMHSLIHSTLPVLHSTLPLIHSTLPANSLPTQPLWAQIVLPGLP